MAAWYKALPESTVYIQSITQSGNVTTVTPVAGNHPFSANQLVTFARIRSSKLTGPKFLVTQVTSSSFNIATQTGGPIPATDIGTVDPTKSYALPDVSSVALELQKVLTAILSDQVIVVVDQDDQIYVPLPQPPTGSKLDLLDYLNQYHQRGSGHDYHEDLGVALLFGCGK